METSPDLSTYLPVHTQIHSDLRRSVSAAAMPRRNRRLAAMARPSFLGSLGLAAALTLGPLAACGSDGADTAAGAAPPTTASAAVPPVTVGDSEASTTTASAPPD